MKLKGTLTRLKNQIKSKYGRNRASVKEEEKLLISPEEQMSRGYEISGLIMRALVVFAGIFGLAFFFFDAVGIYDPSADFRTFTLPLYVMIAAALVFSVLAVLTSYNKITKLAVPLGTVVVLLGAAATYGNPLSFIENTLRRLYNDALYGISTVGYTSFSSYMVNDTYSFDRSSLIVWGAILFCAVLSVLMYFAVVQKARAWLTVIVVASFLCPILSLNIMSNNAGFAFIAAFAAGFFVIRAYESRYMGRYDRAVRRKKRKRAKRAESRRMKEELRLERLKLKAAKDAVFDAAIEAEMGVRRARVAARTVFDRGMKDFKQKQKDEKRLLREREHQLAAEEKADAENKSKSADKSSNAKKARRNRAAGGFAGAGAVLVALLAVWIPAAAASKPFRVIEPIEGTVSQIRRSVSDIIMGDDVNLTASGSYLYGAEENFGYETLSFEPREYKNLLIFKAESGQTMPVYLKSRSALNYSISSDTWSFADSSFVMDYNERFGKGFSPDTITNRAYAYLYPSSNVVPGLSTGTDLSKFGFYVQKITLTRINGESKLFFTPSVFGSNFGILEKGKKTLSPYGASAYFDGVYTSKSFGKGTDGYSAVAYIYNMSDPDIGEKLEEADKVISLVYSYAEWLENGESADVLLDGYNESLSSMSINTNLGEKFLTVMTDEEREAFLSFVELEREYAEYASETYTRSSGSEKIKELADELISSAEEEKGAPLTVYEKVTAVREYLEGEEFIYTLEPKSGEDASASVIETFLFETKEGYCSHFATAATLLLRECGVPVRYCEGYIANDWYLSYGTQVSDTYRSDVTDSDSHTWIEVYFDSVGWVNFEVTKPYCDDVYGAAADNTAVDETYDDKEPEQSVTTSQKPVYGDDEVTITADDYITPEEASRLRALEILKVLLIVGAALIVVFTAASIFVRVMNRRAKKEISRRYALAADAKNEEKYRDFRVDKREMARQIIDSLFLIFSECGIGPKRGELLSAFAERLNRDYSGLSTQKHEKIMEYIVKEEYGHGLSYKEMCALADYYSDVMVSVYTGLSLSQKIRLRYIKRII